MSRIGVVGLGYVGLTTAACLADLGHEVVGHDIDKARVAGLRRNRIPIYEPGLDQLRRDLKDGTWERRHDDLLGRSEIDLGYRLVISYRRAL